MIVEFVSFLFPKVLYLKRKESEVSENQLSHKPVGKNAAKITTKRSFRQWTVYNLVVRELGFGFKLLLVFSTCLILGQTGKQWFQKEIFSAASLSFFTFAVQPSKPVTTTKNQTAVVHVAQNLVPHIKPYRSAPRPVVRQSVKQKVRARLPVKRRPAARRLSEQPTAVKEVREVLSKDYGVVADKPYQEYMNWVDMTLKTYKKPPS